MESEPKWNDIVQVVDRCCRGGKLEVAGAWKKLETREIQLDAAGHAARWPTTGENVWRSKPELTTAELWKTN
jgi:hypothetical protein